MSETLIKVEGLYKKFSTSLKRSMVYGTKDTLRSMVGMNFKQNFLRTGEFWALEDISFELKKGETLGIIGVNGSGKSTLLRLLNGIFPPDAGKIEVNGRIGALIAVGAGFHPHMTGRENIYLNGTILGMTKKEIDGNLEDIIDFAEIGQFIDAPVATYSSGMRVRLGFSIAIHSHPEILLVDEVLSVGDLSFRNKSLRKMDELKEKANGIIFISHNLEQVRVLCGRTIVLDQGKVIFDGDTHNGIVAYEELTRTHRQAQLVKTSKKGQQINIRARESSGDEIYVLNLGLLNDKDEKVASINMDETLKIYYDFRVNTFLKSAYFSVGVLGEDIKSCIWVMSNDNNKCRFENIEQGDYRLLVEIKEHHLMPNVYIPNIAIRNGDTGETYERILPDCSFRVVSDGSHLERGIVAVKEIWSLNKI